MLMIIGETMCRSGDDCHIVDQYWIHRFGTIKTVWAGKFLFFFGLLTYMFDDRERERARPIYYCILITKNKKMLF